MMHKCAYTFICYMLVGYCCTQGANAQCNDVTVNLTATPSTCQSNGTLTVTLSGSDAGKLDMTTALYTIRPVSGSGSSFSTTDDDGIFTDLLPGTYRVTVSADCPGGKAEVESAIPATVAGAYETPNAYIGTVLKTFNCTQKYIGRIPVVISGGLSPYTITMTGYPAAYTGQKMFTQNSAGTLNVDSLPAGNYTFTVADACAYSTSLTVTVSAFTADFVTDMISPYPYMPATPDSTNCREVRISISSNSTYEFYRAFASGMYQAGFVYNGDAATPPNSWQDISPASAYVDYALPVDRDVYKANGDSIAVWIRIKGTTCAQKVRAVKGYSGIGIPLSYEEVNCDTVLVKHFVYGNSINIFCYPLQWCVVHPANSTNPSDTIIPWSERFTHVDTIRTQMPYDSRIVYRDAKGKQIGYTNIQGSALNNIEGDNLSWNRNGLCAEADASGYYPSYLLIRANGTIPVGTRIQYESGPVGAPAPPFHDIITETSLSSVSPYSPTGSYTDEAYAPLVPGTYTFRVTLPGGCGEKTVSVTTYMFRLASSLSISHSEETCEGLRIYPAGELAVVQGTVASSIPTWFSIASGPAGVTFDETSVQGGGSLLLPASGEYVIRLRYYETYGCDMDTLHITYEKKPLSLDVNAISSYICPGSTAGYIRVNGINGLGSYTYQLWSQGGGTLIDTNTSGVFMHGSTGETYTVRVIDGCGTQFDQDVTIRNFSDVKITYSSGSVTKDVFCEGQPLQLHCITLNTSSYTWTGPNGWTSFVQNPVLSHATPAMSGKYTVSVTPQGCNVRTEDIYIIVSPCAVPINPHLRSRMTQ